MTETAIEQELKMTAKQPKRISLPDDLTLSAVHKLYGFLKKKGTFDFNTLSNGLFSAVGNDCRTAAVSGYNHVWIRDNIHIAYAHYITGRKLKAKRCVLCIASFFRKHLFRFMDVIDRKADHNDPMKRPHIRFIGRDLKESSQSWSHAQNDAIGYFLWFYSLLVRQGTISKHIADMELLSVIAKYMETIQYWKDKDSGHWEEERKVSASSIGVVTAGLLELREVLRIPGLRCKNKKNAGYRISRSGLEKLISRGKRALGKILPYECIEQNSTVNRAYDSALLFLIEPLDLLEDKKSEMVLHLVQQYLQGQHGIRRYLMDSYWAPDYRKISKMKRSAAIDMTDRNKLAILGCEAQWCIFDPVISTIYGKRFLKTGGLSCFENQLLYFNRSLGQITQASFPQSYRCPEAYFLENGKYVPNDQVPLLWTQANLMVAFKHIQLSLQKYRKRKYR
jgi:phosphorylase kinase alpha/beta subunit